MKYVIRPIQRSEFSLLKEFTYHAIFQRDEMNLIPKSILEQAEMKVFYENFGQKNDLCLVAETKEKIVGAVWTRILSGAVKGFGNVDAHTPEFAISVLKEYRGYGIGTELMIKMLALLKEKKYDKTSLAVQKDNYAVKMYKSVGFQIIKELEEEYLMLCYLRQEKNT